MGAGGGWEGEEPHPKQDPEVEEREIYFRKNQAVVVCFMFCFLKNQVLIREK